MTGLVHELTISGWTPTRLNQLFGHWRKAHQLKKLDRQMIVLAARLAGLPPATGKRRVDLLLTLGPRQRPGDPDGLWKSLLDGLVAAGCLIDDSARWVELGAVEFERNTASASTIFLTDV